MKKNKGYKIGNPKNGGKSSSSLWIMYGDRRPERADARGIAIYYSDDRKTKRRIDTQHGLTQLKRLFGKHLTMYDIKIAKMYGCTQESYNFTLHRWEFQEQVQPKASSKIRPLYRAWVCLQAEDQAARKAAGFQPNLVIESYERECGLVEGMTVDEIALRTLEQAVAALPYEAPKKVYVYHNYEIDQRNRRQTVMGYFKGFNYIHNGRTLKLKPIPEF